MKPHLLVRMETGDFVSSKGTEVYFLRNVSAEMPTLRSLTRGANLPMKRIQPFFMRMLTVWEALSEEEVMVLF